MKGDDSTQFSQYFEYNGQTADQFNLVLLKFNQDTNIDSGLSRESIKGTTTKFRKRANHFGEKYRQSLTLSLTFVKHPDKYLHDQDLMHFKRSEINEITKWLTSDGNMHWIRAFQNNEDLYDDEIEYLGVFTNIDFQTANGVCGIVCTFECDSPFGYTPERKRKFISTPDSPCNFIIKNESAEIADYVYPKIELYAKSNTNVSIANSTENKSVIYKGLLEGQVIEIDTRLKKIVDKSNDTFIGLHLLGLNDVASIYWPRFLYGVNELVLTGDVELRISYREVRKVGAY